MFEEYSFSRIKLARNREEMNDTLCTWGLSPRIILIKPAILIIEPRLLVYW